MKHVLNRLIQKSNVFYPLNTSMIINVVQLQDKIQPETICLARSCSWLYFYKSIVIKFNEQVVVARET